MKIRLAAFMSAVIMICTLTAGTASAEFASYKIKSFSSGSTAVKTGSYERVSFTAELDGASVPVIDVRDSDGKRVARLYDNGQNGDTCKGDGVYYGEATLYSEKVGVGEYTIDVGQADAACDIKFYRDLNADDIKVHDDIWADIESIEQTLQKTKSADDVIYSRVYEYLESSEDVARVWFENPTTVNFMLTSGIGNIYTRFDEDSAFKGNSTENGATLNEKGIVYSPSDNADLNNANADNYIGNGDIGVWCPYYGSDSNFTMAYYECAEKAVPTAGGSVHAYYGRDADIESFKTWNDYGVVMVDSHGNIYDGKSCISVPFPGEYDTNDLAEGNIYSMGAGGIAITGTFFTKYCPNMQNTLVYIGICHGFETTALYEPLLNAGAGLCIGYDEAVTFIYDRLMMNCIFGLLCTENPVTKSHYTPEQACLEAQRRYGDTDRLGDDAHLVWYGNGNLIMEGVPIKVESISLPENAELYINNTVSMRPVIVPENANRYTMRWKSSDEAVVSVDEFGIAAAHTVGSADITCVITDMYGGNENQMTAVCTVRVLGEMPALGITCSTDAVILAVGGGTLLYADVYPENASNRNVTWSSSDTSVVTVDENGNVKALAAGNAAVTAVSEDNGFSVSRPIRVVEPTVNMAANYGNQNTEFINDTQYPWVIDFDTASGRTSLKSDIAGIDQGYAQLSTEKISLKAGDKLYFDWKASCEDKYDKLVFKLNGSEIKDISGQTDWESVEYTIHDNGDYVFSWCYDKDASDAFYDDCVWLDNVRIKTAYNDTVNVRFIDFDGTIVYSCDIMRGESIDSVYPCSPYREGHTFAGWNVSGEIYSDTVAAAVYSDGERISGADMHKVTFLGYNDRVLSVVYVRDGESARYPSDDYLNTFKAGNDGTELIFIGWDNAYAEITDDTVIHARFGILGDVNENMTIDSGDATLILRTVIGMLDMNDKILMLGDYNKNSQLDSGDATGILRFVVGSTRG